MLDYLIQQLQQSIGLNAEQVADAVGALVDESIAPELKADFLSALARKGESIQEIAEFARLLRNKSIQPTLHPAIRSGQIIDVCGTGGDRLGTFNVSTTVAFVVAAAGIPVAKHGNRAVTSRSGSADVLESLGIRINMDPDQAARMLQDQQFAFFFAPQYHPAFKQIAPARKLCAARGQPTIFNFLGPLLNPVRPTAQLLGVSHPRLCPALAQVLQSLGLHRAMVVCGTVPGNTPDPPQYLDELSTLGPTAIAAFYQEHGFHASHLAPDAFPIQSAALDQLRGGDPKTNAASIQQLLAGQDRGPKRDLVLLNAGAALLVAGAVPNLQEGWTRAAQLIDDGRAAAKLNHIAAASAAL